MEYNEVHESLTGLNYIYIFFFLLFKSILATSYNKSNRTNVYKGVNAKETGQTK